MNKKDFRQMLSLSEIKEAMPKPVTGFSKLSKSEKIAWLETHCFSKGSDATTVLEKYWNTDPKLQQLHDDFIENTVSNYYMPFAVVPNFDINGRLYVLPMAIEESSVVAAAANAAKFWLKRGGFKAEVVSTRKNGQVHIDYHGPKEKLYHFFDDIKPLLFGAVEGLSTNMKKRGGGVMDIELIDKTTALTGYYQVHATFETADAMGANYINSCLEQLAQNIEKKANNSDAFAGRKNRPRVVMSILSNYVPKCLVRAEVRCPVEQLGFDEYTGAEFAKKFVRAVQIAGADVHRAVTHNKGIMNGIDAVVLATGNDFRAVEAGIHAWASRDGQYRSLTQAEIRKGVFRFWTEIPLAVGTVGGLTSLHPLVKVALEMLQKPTARELMQIMAVAGLAQNFAALRSLVTTGIQHGHMKMHLKNILNQLDANDRQKEKAMAHFADRPVSYATVQGFLARQ